ncbi:fibrillarin-like rRNA/tRNA 2'-O-methyltransferase [Candidatus Woesearchaeota archaeon]|nr:fibrillarin-like rRNA/tRNA 2'-O-methyltransferase [Candidatus Woesearchaeota archaeon]
MIESSIFGVYEERNGKRRELYTKNLVPGMKVYAEKLVSKGQDEFRQWDPRKSKLAAAILKGSPNIGIRKNDIVLYLGCSTGTTVSHVSDLVGAEGFVFGLDSSPRVLRDFIFLCEKRKNITALLEDANKPLDYVDKVCQVDILYQDIAQRNQPEIFLKNVDIFLKKGGYALFAVKSRSIDVTKNPKVIFQQVRSEIEKKLTIIDYRTLDPFELDHCMFICKK